MQVVVAWNLNARTPNLENFNRTFATADLSEVTSEALAAEQKQSAAEQAGY